MTIYSLPEKPVSLTLKEGDLDMKKTSSSVKAMDQLDHVTKLYIDSFM